MPGRSDQLPVTSRRTVLAGTLVSIPAMVPAATLPSLFVDEPIAAQSIAQWVSYALYGEVLDSEVVLLEQLLAEHRTGQRATLQAGLTQAIKANHPVALWSQLYWYLLSELLGYYLRSSAHFRQFCGIPADYSFSDAACAGLLEAPTAALDAATGPPGIASERRLG